MMSKEYEEADLQDDGGSNAGMQFPSCQIERAICRLTTTIPTLLSSTTPTLLTTTTPTQLSSTIPTPLCIVVDQVLNPEQELYCIILDIAKPEEKNNATHKES